MDRCDVLIVGGGPAGSSCARALRQAGLDVVVMDKAAFPRDKTCAGWITPAVIELLALDIEDYRQQRVFQPISGFRTGVMDGPALETRHDHAVSYGIRRCEFDTYLLARADARLRTAEPLTQLVRDADGWRVNASLQTPLIVGAGGHFCPVARRLGADVGQSELAVRAQESEFELDPAQRAACRCQPGMPELYFCKDLKGYGWCMRKGDFLNIGLGREGEPALAQHVTAFREFLGAAGRIPAGLQPRFKGHAYLLYRHARRTLLDDGVLLAGDAAGLACTESGEGIRPAIESGLMAAATILQAQGRYTRADLEPYRARLQARFGPREARDWSAWLPQPVKSRLATGLMGNRWFVQHVLLERWFLHTQQPSLRI
ncbi:MAG TPA: NAD(P)/FAD-dependent oxidoreductase [Gammaproteobacteria bacterium]|nr:NAD(P)/FAD-dependent oxidoreductase [Gammaproteobacteria bacterium]